MDDGTTAAKTRGRSEEPRNGTSNRDRNRTSSGKAGKEKGKKSASKKNGASSGSRSSSRLRTTESKQNTASVTPNNRSGNRTTETGIAGEGSGGRRIKMEEIEAKTQQTLTFTTQLEAYKGQDKTEGTKEKPVEIEDEMTAQVETPETNNTSKTRASGKSPKRKQSEVGQGRDKVSPAMKRGVLNSRKRISGTPGRGGGLVRSDIQGPPNTTSTARTGEGFTLATEYMRELDRKYAEEDTKSGIDEDGTKNKGKEDTAKEGDDKNGTREKKRTVRDTGRVTNEDANMEDSTEQREDEKRGDNNPTPNEAYHKTPPTVENPYKKKTTEEKERPVSYVRALNSPQTRIKTHEKKWEKHDNYFDVGFTLKELSNNPGMEEIRMNMKEILKSILRRAKEVHRKSKINTWFDEADLPTISKVEDIPESPLELQAYLSPLRRDARMIKGRNNGWRVRITTNIGRREFVHHWGLSKRDFQTENYVTLRDAPLQSPTYHAAGYFINSGDEQWVQDLETKLSEEVGFRVGLAYRPGALDKRYADALWRAAKQARQAAPMYEKGRTFFKLAPFVLQMYTATRAQAIEAAQHFSKQYGSLQDDGQYPRLPDGTRMRFIAAHIYLDMQGRSTAARLFQQQIRFQRSEVITQIPIRDPCQRFPSQGNKSMQELCMDLKDGTQSEEPYFRYIKKRFHWNFKTMEWEVSIHSKMYPAAARILKDFKGFMTETYGQEVGDAILDADPHNTRSYNAESTMGAMSSGISIATEDRYLNGNAQFIITGLENVQLDTEEQPEDIRKDEEDETMNVKSTGSGFTNHTGNTVPSVKYFNGDQQSRSSRLTETDTPSVGTNIITETSQEKEPPDEREGEWKTVPKGKGGKPRELSIYERTKAAFGLQGLGGAYT